MSVERGESEMSSKIEVHHVTRVEGHGNIVVNTQNGEVSVIEWQIPEAPRFFEAMVHGQTWDNIQSIVSRICGICSISHSLAAVKGIEAAMGIEVSEQTDKLRHLAHYSEQVQSHVLHIGYLVSPDLLGAGSVMGLVQTHTTVVQTVIKLHRLANQWADLITGRTTHPVTLQPGRFTALPPASDLRQLRDDLTAAVPSLKQLAGVVAELTADLPHFEHDTEYVALKDGHSYTFYHGDIGSTDIASTVPVSQFESVVNEYLSPQSTAKWTKWHRDSYSVGALARYHLNGTYLTPMAKEVAQAVGLLQHSNNPYYNSVAQLVECVHLVEGAVQLIDELLTQGLRPEQPQIEPGAGEGVGAVEAPRGILFHRYAFDAQGRCEASNLTIPSNQNHALIQQDMEAFVPQILDQGEDQIRLSLEMLVRSYDPCISCSTHFLDVKFV